ncbi:MAG: AI-2E family transporter [Deltaproteobacteria bacterium]|nr:AI-2E family transporter [Deltaproteobacteria bacterium]
MELIRRWMRSFLADPQVVVLFVVLLIGAGVVLFFGDLLAPLIGSVVIAFLLEGLVKPLLRLRMPRLLAVGIVFTLFMCFLVVLVLGLLPILSKQITQFIGQLPEIVRVGQQELLKLPEKYPQFISPEQVNTLLGTIASEATSLGRQAVTYSLASVRSALTFVVYMVLVPIMVFFLLKDKDKLLDWVRNLLPADHGLASQVWQDVRLQTGNYVRGKIWEVFIIWGLSYAVFWYLDLNYAMLLGLLVGISVIIPYVGATLVTFPVAILAYFQWGWGSDFLILMAAYTVIQIFDGNILVPVLLSEVMDLHPIAIISSILVFGGLWGIWGVFFAIPLATLLQSVLVAMLARRSMPGTASA